MNTLRPLRRHCLDLAALLCETAIWDENNNLNIRDKSHCRWSNVGQHLKIAASVVSLEVDTNHFGSYKNQCSRSWRLHSATSRVNTALVAEISAFNFAWGAFETAVSVVRPRGVSGSTVDTACRFIKEIYEPEKPVPEYDQTIASLRTKLARHELYCDLEKDFSANHPLNNTSTTGLQIVSKCRNRFALGWLGIPINEKSNWNEDIEIIRLNFRLVLFSIQHLALGFLKRDPLAIANGKDEDSCLYDLEKERVLRNLHLIAWQEYPIPVFSGLHSNLQMRQG